MAANAAVAAAETLLAERTRLLNAIAHLERSQEELVNAADTDPDPVFYESVRENEQVLERMKAKADELAMEINAIAGPGTGGLGSHQVHGPHDAPGGDDSDSDAPNRLPAAPAANGPRHGGAGPAAAPPAPPGPQLEGWM